MSLRPDLTATTSPAGTPLERPPVPAGPQRLVLALHGGAYGRGDPVPSPGPSGLVRGQRAVVAGGGFSPGAHGPVIGRRRAAAPRRLR